MYPRNYLKNSRYIEISSRYCKIIDQFKKAHRRGVESVSISFILINCNMSQEDIYNDINDLLELKILKIQEYAECPYCIKHNVLTRKSQYIKCSRCGRYYCADSLDESFTIDRMFLDEEK